MRGDCCPCSIMNTPQPDGWVTGFSRCKEKGPGRGDRGSLMQWPLMYGGLKPHTHVSSEMTCAYTKSTNALVISVTGV